MNENKMKRFIEVIVHNSACNLKCHYCYLTQQGVETNQRPVWKYSPEYIAKCLSPERLGGYCCFNMCADGETLISKETVEIIYLLAKQGHHINIVTNGTLTHVFEQMAQWDRTICEHITCLFSYHYLELKRLNLLDTFFSNVKRVHAAGVSFTIMAVLCDEYWDCMDDLQAACKEALGAPPHFMPYRDTKLNFVSRYSDEEYMQNGRSLDSALFNVHVDYYHRKISEFCYAGEWFCCLDLVSGDLRSCYAQPVFDNAYKTPELPIRFEAIGRHCNIAYCYNSHSRIGLGVVPDVKCDYLYADAANRVCNDGSEWFYEISKEFHNIKLYEMNRQYDVSEMVNIDKNYEKKYAQLKSPFISLHRFSEKIHRFFNKG